MNRKKPSSGSRVNAMPRWMAYLLITLCFFVTTVLLWFGSAIVVHCERGADSGVNVTVQRRFLGLFTLREETVRHVTKASIEVESRRTSQGGRRTRTRTEQLVLISPEKGKWLSPICTPSFGTRPKAMAVQINAFINTPATPSLSTWWMPWIVNLCALPFLFVSTLMILAIGEGLLRDLGYLKLDTAKEP